MTFFVNDLSYIPCQFFYVNAKVFYFYCLSGIIKEFPLVSRWFITLAKTEPFARAVWGASNEVGYDAYHSFLLQRGKSSSLTTVLPSKGGQSACQSAGQSAAQGASHSPKVRSEARVETQAAHKVSFTFHKGGFPS